MLFNLRQLRYFVAAAEHGTVAGAARVLHISQPSVSAAITKLEQSFEVQLFHRQHAQGVTLTAAGRQVLGRARQLLAHAHEVEQDVASLATEVHGEVSLGCFASFAPLFMPALMASFAQTYPGAHLRLHEGSDDALLAALHDGRFDAAVMYEPAARADLAVDLLRELPPYALLPADHSLATQRRVSLHDLAHEPIILLDVAPSREYLHSLFSHMGLKPVVRHHSPSFETVRGMVGKGLGVSVLVTRPQGDHSYDGDSLVCLPLEEHLPGGRVAFVQLPQSHPTRLLRAFREFCIDHFAQQA